MVASLLLSTLTLAGSAAAASPWGLGDRDGDGLSNAIERSLGSSPFRADTDEDGWSDWEEYVSGSDGTDPASVP